MTATDGPGNTTRTVEETHGGRNLRQLGAPLEEIPALIAALLAQ